MKLSVVLGSFNRLDHLKRCVRSVFDQTETPVKVYVTDAGSTDGTCEYLKLISSNRIIPILAGEKLGQAKAYNDVFDMVDTPYVCWISDDNVIVNHGLDIGVRILEQNPSMGMVALKVRDMEGPFVEAPYVGGVSEIGILNVNQGMLPTKVLRQVGGFSLVFRDYGIDADLTAKVLFAGYDIAYTRQVAIHHYRDWGPDKSSPRFRKMMELQRAYIDKYRSKYEKHNIGGVFWKLKRYVWRALWRQRMQRNYSGSTRAIFGQIPRDWNNIFTSRYISALDPILCAGRDYHLVQRWPRGKRPESPPPDPVP